MPSPQFPHQFLRSVVVRQIAQKLWTRDLFSMDSVFIAPLVFLVILSAIAFAGLFYITWRAWACARGQENIDIEAALTISPERRLSYWMSQNVAMRQSSAMNQHASTRKNSNIVWTTNPEDNDTLDFQFSLPSKSRFSMDSDDSADVSICPLDRSYTVKSEREKYYSIVTEVEIESDSCDSSCTSPCRSPVESILITALDKVRAVSQPFLYQYQNHLEDLSNNRRSSMPYHHIQLQL